MKRQEELYQKVRLTPGVPRVVLEIELAIWSTRSTKPRRKIILGTIERFDKLRGGWGSCTMQRAQVQRAQHSPLSSCWSRVIVHATQYDSSVSRICLIRVTRNLPSVAACCFCWFVEVSRGLVSPRNAAITVIWLVALVVRLWVLLYVKFSL